MSRANQIKVENSIIDLKDKLANIGIDAKDYNSIIICFLLFVRFIKTAEKNDFSIIKKCIENNCDDDFIQYELEKNNQKYPNIFTKIKINIDQILNPGVHSIQEPIIKLANSFPEHIKALFFNKNLNGKDYITRPNGDQKNFESLNIHKWVQKLSSENLLQSFFDTLYHMPISPDELEGYEMSYVLEQIYKEYSDTNPSKSGSHYTPVELTNLAAIISSKLAKFSNNVSIQDWACGAGGMLIAGYEKIKLLNKECDVKLYGQEYLPTPCILAKGEVLLLQQNAQQIRWGDSLQYVSETKTNVSNIVLMNPPFGAHLKPTEKDIECFKRNSDIFPSEAFSSNKYSCDFELLFHLLAINTLIKDGCACIIGSTGILSNNKDKLIRKNILKNLYAVLLFEMSLFKSTSIPVCMLIYKKDWNTNFKNEVLFADCTSFATKYKDKTKGSKKKFIYTEENIQKIADIVLNRKEINEISKLVDINTIKENDYSFSVNNYVKKEIVYEEIDINEVKEILRNISREITDNLEELNRLEKEFIKN